MHAHVDIYRCITILLLDVLTSRQLPLMVGPDQVLAGIQGPTPMDQAEACGRRG